jgi:uncharacterized protein YdeI (YjbR/CyaY-like superfamily)
MDGARPGTVTDDLPVVAFASADDFEAWLEREHLSSPGVWVRIAKKGSGTPTVTYAEAVEVALCFGWIDGRKVRGDEVSWLQRFTPRRARSQWSQVNRDKVAGLSAAGRMRPAGTREVEAAQADGRWDAAYAGMAAREVPDDLRVALESAGLLDLFTGLTSAQRYSITYRVAEAKRPETRARRIAAFVDLLAHGETPHGPIA